MNDEPKYFVRSVSPGGSESEIRCFDDKGKAEKYFAMRVSQDADVELQSVQNGRWKYIGSRWRS